jgi:DNA-binding NarL/FixJ family response regulator
MKIVIADKQVLFRLGIESALKKYPQYEIVDQVETKSEMMDSLKKHKPDVLIVDFMEIEFLKAGHLAAISEQYQQTSCLILTNNDIDEDISEMLDIDIAGYLLKNCNIHELIVALDSISQGKKYFCSKVVEILFSNRNHKSAKPIDNHNSLTKKELEIIELIAQGISYKEIADKLFISLHTAHTHRKNIFKKTGVKKSSELIRFALRNNIIDDIDYYI